MVIRLMPHGHFLFPDPLTELAVRERGRPVRSSSRRLVPEEPAQVVQEPGGAGEEGRSVIHMVQKISVVLTALGSRTRKPSGGGLPVLWDAPLRLSAGGEPQGAGGTAAALANHAAASNASFSTPLPSR